eukprot:TRINITY_DN112874_c0_g1_i1.p1 TRINITY_DN112874_c0_g1~~TRINITY_DN112874_c0_g1_i1.p1  ORF type:complete len:298 (-),score=118.91 TRINITY_DN112874_c0_g1_i1:85-978(-)
MSSASPPQSRLKIVLVGDMFVGKSALVHYATQEAFLSSSRSTIGQDVVAWRHGGRVFNLWDTAGQESHRCMPSLYYRHASAVMIVFDLNEPQTLSSCIKWLVEVRSHLDLAKTPVMLVGNKNDLSSSPKLIKQAEQWCVANNIGAGFVATSCKDGHNVQHAFRKLASIVLAGSTNADAAVRTHFRKSLSKGKAMAGRSNSRSNSVGSRNSQSGAGGRMRFFTSPTNASSSGAGAAIAMHNVQSGQSPSSIPPGDGNGDGNSREHSQQDSGQASRIVLSSGDPYLHKSGWQRRKKCCD